MKILLNRKEIANRFNVTISRNIAFIGNTLERTEPAGVICDLRIFDSIIPDELVISTNMLNYWKRKNIIFCEGGENCALQQNRKLARISLKYS